MAPKRASAARTASSILSRAVTSSATASTSSGCASARSCTESGLRAVATTRWPCRSAASASALPRPVEQPVINHVDIALLLPVVSGARPCSEGDDAAGVASGVEVVDRLVDRGQRVATGHELVELQLALAVELDIQRHVDPRPPAPVQRALERLLGAPELVAGQLGDAPGRRDADRDDGAVG